PRNSRTTPCTDKAHVQAVVPRARRQAWRRRVAPYWENRCQARFSAPDAAPDDCGQAQKRQNRSVDRDSGRRPDRTGIDLDPSESPHRSRWSSALGRVARSGGAHAWNCAAPAALQTARKHLDMNLALATYVG